MLGIKVNKYNPTEQLNHLEILNFSILKLAKHTLSLELM